MPWLDMSISGLEVEKRRNGKHSTNSNSYLGCKWRLECEHWGDWWVPRSKGQIDQTLTAALSGRHSAQTTRPSTLARAGHLDKGSVRVSKWRPAGTGFWRKIISVKCQAFPNSFPQSSMKSLSKCNNTSNMSTNICSVYIIYNILYYSCPITFRDVKLWFNKNILMCWLSTLLRSSI